MEVGDTVEAGRRCGRGDVVEADRRYGGEWRRSGDLRCGGDCLVLVPPVGHE